MSSAHTAGQPSPVLVQTAVLVAVRAAFFLSCRHFVNSSLFSDLRSVIREDNPLLASSTHADDGAAPLDSSISDNVALEDMEEGNSYFEPNHASRQPTASLLSYTTTHSAPGSPTTTRHRDSVVSGSPRLVKVVRRQNELFSKVATALFCLSFSESSMLFTLVLLADLFGERARLLNWSISLTTLVCLIVFVIPLGACLLLMRRTRSSFSFRMLLLSLVPFGIYLATFYEIGSWIASKTVVEPQTSLGFINGLLSRICVPGVVLIASLSGGGAVNTAWESFQWRSIGAAEAVTENQVLAAERSLARIRSDLSQRLRSLEAAEASAAREAEANRSQSLFARWTTSQPAKSQVSTLRVEVAALQGLEQQMTRDVMILKKRKAIREMTRTAKGRLWLAMGWALSFYCVWRVIISLVNLIFGLSQRRHHGQENDGSSPDPNAAAASADVLTLLLAKLARIMNIDIDVATWSRLLGLALIGGIILANIRNVLGSVSRVFKAASTGISASFMLLFLSQLMAVYLLTSLISLPDSPSSSTMALLDTLPSFNVFSRLFDIVFLLAATVVFIGRWVEKKVRVEDGISSQYSY